MRLRACLALEERTDHNGTVPELLHIHRVGKEAGT